MKFSANRIGPFLQSLMFYDRGKSEWSNNIEKQKYIKAEEQKN